MAITSNKIPFISGFTIVRNAIIYDYPVLESITSILPLCDEFIVCVGKSEDETLELIKSINSPKIKIIESVWDDSIRVGGKVLAIETNKAFDAVSYKADWAFYLQSDEVVHESYLPVIKEAATQYMDNKNVEGLLFDYKHFFGSYHYYGISRKWYRREVRIIRNDKSIRSYKDAQGFRKHNRKLMVIPIHAEIYHYGWVKPPEIQQGKKLSFNKLWHSDDWIKEHVPPEFNYHHIVQMLAEFKDTHPQVMMERVKQQDWSFVYHPDKIKATCIQKIAALIEEKTGWRPGEFKNFRIIS